MKLLLSLSAIALMISSQVKAEPCDPKIVVKKTALAVEKISSGGVASPLTKSLYSLNSQQNTWAAVLGYSGIQRTYTITTSDDGCRIVDLHVQ